MPSSRATHVRGGKKSSKDRKSLTERAGLQFPAARVKRLLKKSTNSANRVSPGAAVYTAAVLEYLTAELVEISGMEAVTKGRLRINPRHLNLAIQKDLDFAKMLKDVTIAQGGVIPGQSYHADVVPNFTRSMRVVNKVMRDAESGAISKEARNKVLNNIRGKQLRDAFKHKKPISKPEEDKIIKRLPVWMK